MVSKPVLENPNIFYKDKNKPWKGFPAFAPPGKAITGPGLKGKTAFITGADLRMGGAADQAFACEGAGVFLNDLGLSPKKCGATEKSDPVLFAGKPEEIADAIIFAFRQAERITGQVHCAGGRNKMRASACSADGPPASMVLEFRSLLKAGGFPVLFLF